VARPARRLRAGINTMRLPAFRFLLFAHDLFRKPEVHFSGSCAAEASRKEVFRRRNGFYRSLPNRFVAWSSLRALAKQSSSGAKILDCFVAELVIGPATSGRTRWLLAMTRGKNSGAKKTRRENASLRRHCRA
jgi:hypothetical protein